MSKKVQFATRVRCDPCPESARGEASPGCFVIKLEAHSHLDAVKGWPTWLHSKRGQWCLVTIELNEKMNHERNKWEDTLVRAGKRARQDERNNRLKELNLTSKEKQ